MKEQWPFSRLWWNIEKGWKLHNCLPFISRARIPFIPNPNTVLMILFKDWIAANNSWYKQSRIMTCCITTKLAAARLIMRLINMRPYFSSLTKQPENKVYKTATEETVKYWIWWNFHQEEQCFANSANSLILISITIISFTANIISLLSDGQTLKTVNL